jgi:hypothetical protein
MTSPNFSEYIDLTIYDVDAFQVYNDAIVYARDAVPEFQPRTGTLEEAIIQAISFNTALISSQINRLPDGLMEGIARLSGLERLEATFATGQALFEVFDNNGVTIPAGTVIAYESINDDIIISYPFETVGDLVIPEGSTTGTVSIQATDAGVYPALLATQELELVSPAPGVIEIQLSAAISVGTNSETDADFLTRASRHFTSLSSALVTKNQLINFIKANYPSIGSVAVFDLTNPYGTLDWDEDLEPGYVTIVLTDASGIEISSAQSSQLIDDISSKTVAGLVVDSVEPASVGVSVEVDIVIADGYDSTETRNAVNAYLSNRLSTLGYDFSGTIIKNELISSVANITGVRYVKSLSMVSSDVLLLEEDGQGNLDFVKKNGVPNGNIEVTSS